MKFTKPSPSLTAFHCVQCNAYSAQNWYRTFISQSDKPCYFEQPKYHRRSAISKAEHQDLLDVWRVGSELGEPFALKEGFFVNEHSTYSNHHLYFVDVSQCSHCEHYSIWIKGQMVYPDTGAGVPPHEDLPKHLHADYMEAASIIDRSPRGAAALLRLILEQLLHHVGDEKKKSNDNIKDLVTEKRLSPEVQKACDIIRITGNNAVHPGQLDIKDNADIVASSFELINAIVDEVITRPKKMAELMNRMPEGAVEATERRDKTSE